MRRSWLCLLFGIFGFPLLNAASAWIYGVVLAEPINVLIPFLFGMGFGWLLGIFSALLVYQLGIGNAFNVRCLGVAGGCLGLGIAANLYFYLHSVSTPAVALLPLVTPTMWSLLLIYAAIFVRKEQLRS